MPDDAAEQAPETSGVSIRERGKTERRIRVVEAARDIVTVGGVAALSMRALSIEAGVSVPTIYNLIGGRDNVLAAVLDELAAVFDAEVAVSSSTGLDRCFELAERLLDTLTPHPVLARSVIAEGLTPLLTTADASLFQRYGLAQATALTDAASAGELREGTAPILIVDQLVSLTAVRTLRWATGDPTTDVDGEHLIAATTHGIGLVLAGAASDGARGQVLDRVDRAQTELLGGGLR